MKKIKNLKIDFPETIRGFHAKKSLSWILTSGKSGWRFSKCQGTKIKLLNNTRSIKMIGMDFISVNP
jgi:hypothetical protein